MSVLLCVSLLAAFWVGYHCGASADKRRRERVNFIRAHSARAQYERGSVPRVVPGG